MTMQMGARGAQPPRPSLYSPQAARLSVDCAILASVVRASTLWRDAHSRNTHPVGHM